MKQTKIFYQKNPLLFQLQWSEAIVTLLNLPELQHLVLKYDGRFMSYMGLGTVLYLNIS